MDITIPENRSIGYWQMFYTKNTNGFYYSQRLDKSPWTDPAADPVVLAAVVEEVKGVKADWIKWVETERHPLTFKGKLVVTQHCAMGGDMSNAAREAIIYPAEKYAQYDRCVTTSFVQPRKRNWLLVRMYPRDSRYLTVTKGGVVVYDSRTEIPCDMAKWAEVQARFKDRWAAV